MSRLTCRLQFPSLRYTRYVSAPDQYVYIYMYLCENANVHFHKICRDKTSPTKQTVHMNQHYCTLLVQTSHWQLKSLRGSRSLVLFQYGMKISSPAAMSHAYHARDGGGTRVLDISTPSKPRQSMETANKHVCTTARCAVPPPPPPVPIVHPCGSSKRSPNASVNLG